MLASGTGGTDSGAQGEEDEDEDYDDISELEPPDAEGGLIDSKIDADGQHSERGTCDRNCIMSPDDAMKVRWDCFVGVLIIYTVIVLPLRISFDQENRNGTGPVVVFDHCVDLCFAVDMILWFRTGFYTTQGVYVSQPHAIAKRYITTFFVPDFLSCLPVELLAVLFTSSADDADDSTESMRPIKLLKFVRLIRLVKLMRLIRKGEQILLERFDVNPSLIRMVKLILKIILLVHLLACLWHFIATPVCDLDGWPDDQACPEADPEDHTAEEPSPNWVRFFSADHFGLGSRYIASFHLVTATMMAVGYGDIHATNTIERLVSIVMQLVGAVYFGFILSAVTELLESTNRRDTEYKNRLGMVKEWVLDRRLPRHLRRAVREHFAYVLSKRSVFDEEDILGNMPTQLRTQIVKNSYPRVLKDVSLRFVREHVALQVELVVLLRPQHVRRWSIVMEAGEISHDIFMVCTGVLEGALYSDEPIYPPAEWPRRCLRIGMEMQRTKAPSLGSGSGRSMSRGVSSLREEVLCAVYERGDMFAQFPACPMLVRNTSSRAEILCCGKDVFLSTLARFPGALERYEDDERRELKELMEVFQSANVPKDSLPRPCRTLVLVSGRAREARLMRHTAMYDTPAGPQSELQVEHIAEEEDGVVGDAKRPADEDIDATPEEDSLEEDSLSPADHAGSSTESDAFGVPKEVEHRKVSGKRIDSRFPKTHCNLVSDDTEATPPLTTLRLNGATGEVEEQDEEESAILERWVVPPLHRHKFKWDVFIGVLIVYSVLAIPVRIAFELSPTELETVVDVVVDVLFVLDLVLNFRTAFVNENGITNTITAAIRRRYLQGWFWIDFLSLLPVDHLAQVFLSSGSGSGQVRAIRLVRIVRLARLLKLVRLLRMGRLIQTFEEFLELSPMCLRLLKLGSTLMVLAHLIGCFWFYSSSQVDTTASACSTGRVRGCEGEAATKWWQGVQIEEGQKTEQYIAALYWAFTTMTTVGYGDIIPQNNYERVYAIATMIFGATIFGYIIGSVASLAGQKRGVEAQIKRHIALVRGFCEEHGVSKKREKMARTHYQFYYQQRPPVNEALILAQLPGPLRKKVVLHIHRSVISRLGLFAKLTDETTWDGSPMESPLSNWFVAWTVRLLEPQVFMAGEDILYWRGVSAANQEIFFVYEGLCEAYPMADEGEQNCAYAPDPAQTGSSDTGGSCDDAAKPSACDFSSGGACRGPPMDEERPIRSNSTRATSPKAESEGLPEQPIATFLPGSMFGLGCALKCGSYRVCCSALGSCMLFSLQHTVLNELKASVVPEMAVALRTAISNAVIQQVRTGTCRDP